jgi:hypothetical protein
MNRIIAFPPDPRLWPGVIVVLYPGEARKFEHHLSPDLPFDGGNFVREQPSGKLLVIQPEELSIDAPPRTFAYTLQFDTRTPAEISDALAEWLDSEGQTPSGRCVAGSFDEHGAFTRLPVAA